ncbi:alternate-type signal peptide domain-containing protein [Georgenia wangjunii]|uniref:alternate-type signal peptide domain-containing protein n=1 Tax=Georgenia wangjunii TaxID=3117730 RepID=UPI002F26AD04
MSRSTTAPSSSRKATKAVVATALGVALLAAGGSTFANWSDTQEYGANDINSGLLTLTSTGGEWTNSLGDDVDLAAYAVVPGEVLTFSDTVTINAEGDILAATLATNVATIAAGSSAAAEGSVPTEQDVALADALVASYVFTVDGTVVNEANPFAVTADNNGDELDVQVQVTFPDSVSGTTAQDATANLDGLEVVLTQNAVSAN